jgi:lipopolysaccharide export system permease protein
VVVYFLYSNLISTGKVWLAHGSIPQFLGLWWTHLVIASLAFAFISGPRSLAHLRLRLRG